MYQPGITPKDPALIPQYLEAELQKLQRLLSDKQPILNVKMSYAAPQKPRDGMIVLADGTSWNPGSGAGYYGYRAGAWRFLG